MKTNRRKLLSAAAATAALAVFASPARAHAGHEHHAAPARDSSVPVQHGAVVRLPDVGLVDQHGRPLRLQHDLIGDRIVLVDFIYTSCTTICPVASAIMSEVQTRLGDRLGRDVSLVSVTVDPVRDTPSRLLAYSRKHEARPGWSWITGSSERINATLKGFGTYAPNFEDHPAVMMVGDGRTGRWTRFYGFTDPQVLLGEIDKMFASRGTPASGLRNVSSTEHRHQ